MIRVLLAGFTCALVLSACGGGGGGSSSSSSSSSSGGVVNPPPVMAAQTFGGTEDTALTGQLVATDTDASLAFVVATNPMGGAVSMTGAGAFTYTPNANFSGTDTFTARVTDPLSQSVTATITLNVANVNDAPAATNDVLTVAASSAINVLGNDVDADNEALTVTITSQPFTGPAVVNADRTVDLQLPAGFRGFSKFSYRITDAAGMPSDATALVFVGVQPFSVLTWSPPATPGAPSGIFLHDLFTSRLVHEPTIALTDFHGDYLFQSEGGRAVAFKVNTPAGVELRYVDLQNPGQSRLVYGPVPAAELDWVIVSRTGRFVVFEVKPSAGHQQLHVFDRDSTAGSQRLSLPDDQQAYAALGVFNPAGDALYYPGHRETSQPWASAIFRADLASLQVVRVSPESMTQTHNLVFPLPDDTGYVDMRIHNNGMATYLTRNNNPAGEAALPDANPDNVNTFYPAELSGDGNHFVFTERNAFGVNIAVRLAQTGNPGTSSLIGGPGFGAAFFNGPAAFRRDGLGMLLVKEGISPTVIYESYFASPAALTTVFSAAGNGLFSTAYTEDSARVSFVRYIDSTDVSLSVTRRETFGQTTRLTPPADRVITYRTDPTGYVALASFDGAPGKTALVNLDLPLMMLPIGPSRVNYLQMQVIPR
jgi:VCBS repeat-containing protein